MTRQLSSTAAIATAALTLAFSSVASAETVLRASHQFPGGQGDVRDEMVQMIAKEVEAADVDAVPVRAATTRGRLRGNFVSRGSGTHTRWARARRRGRSRSGS